jgi:hypothetical protein
VLPHPPPLIFLPRGEEVELVPASDRVPDDMGLGGVGVERAEGGRRQGGRCRMQWKEGERGRRRRRHDRATGAGCSATWISSVHCAQPLFPTRRSPRPPSMTMGTGTNMVRARAFSSKIRLPAAGPWDWEHRAGSAAQAAIELVSSPTSRCCRGGGSGFRVPPLERRGQLRAAAAAAGEEGRQPPCSTLCEVQRF